jgi:hypothetical protein
MRKCSGSLPIEAEIYMYVPEPFTLGVEHYLTGVKNCWFDGAATGLERSGTAVSENG